MLTPSVPVYEGISRFDKSRSTKGQFLFNFEMVVAQGKFKILKVFRINGGGIFWWHSHWIQVLLSQLETKKFASFFPSHR